MAWSTGYTSDPWAILLGQAPAFPSTRSTLEQRCLPSFLSPHCYLPPLSFVARATCPIAQNGLTRLCRWYSERERCLSMPVDVVQLMLIGPARVLFLSTSLHSKKSGSNGVRSSNRNNPDEIKSATWASTSQNQKLTFIIKVDRKCAREYSAYTSVYI